MENEIPEEDMQLYNKCLSLHNEQLIKEKIYHIGLPVAISIFIIVLLLAYFIYRRRNRYKKKKRKLLQEKCIMHDEMK